MESLREETFRPLLNQVFTITASPDHGMELTLVAVSTGVHMGPSRRQFSLLFRGPQAPIWGQGSYQVENSALGVLEIFLCPVGVTAMGAEYEAVFS